MKKTFKEVFDKISKSWPEHSSLICFTEAILITNPKPRYIRKYFNKYVMTHSYRGENIKELLNDIFGDMMKGNKSEKYERLENY